MTNQTKVLLVDDHLLVLEGVKMILSNQENVLVVGAVQNGQEAVDFVDKQHVDVVLMDVSMPIMGGLVACKLIKEKKPSVKIIFLTSYDDQGLLLEMIAAGANGCLKKENGMLELLDALERVKVGKKYFDDIGDASDNNSTSELGCRETAVLRELCLDRTNLEIGKVLCISENTVKTHIRNIKTKLKVSTRSGLVMYAINNLP